MENPFKEFCLESYNKDFHKMHIENPEFKYQEEFGKIICKTFDIKSVIDFGCGVANGLYGASQLNIPIKGMEITLINSIEFINPTIRKYITDEDITSNTFDNSKKYDCAWSFEVAEHIKSYDSTQFIKNITSVAERLIVFTAAPPGQGGVGHINCQPPEFWENLFKKFGFINNQNYTLKLLSESSNLRLPWYIVRNLIVFTKD